MGSATTEHTGHSTLDIPNSLYQTDEALAQSFQADPKGLFYAGANSAYSSFCRVNYQDDLPPFFIISISHSGQGALGSESHLADLLSKLFPPKGAAGGNDRTAQMSLSKCEFPLAITQTPKPAEPSLLGVGG